MTQHVVVLLIMDIESAKSDVNGPKKKVCFHPKRKNSKTSRDIPKGTAETMSNRISSGWI